MAVRVVIYSIEVYGFAPEAEKKKPFWDTMHYEIEGVAAFYSAGERVSSYAAVNSQPRVGEGDA